MSKKEKHRMRWTGIMDEIRELSLLELTSFLGALHEYIHTMDVDDIKDFFK